MIARFGSAGIAVPAFVIVFIDARKEPSEIAAKLACELEGMSQGMTSAGEISSFRLEISSGSVVIMLSQASR